MNIPTGTLIIYYFKINATTSRKRAKQINNPALLHPYFEQNKKCTRNNEII